MTAVRALRNVGHEFDDRQFKRDRRHRLGQWRLDGSVPQRARLRSSARATVGVSRPDAGFVAGRLLQRLRSGEIPVTANEHYLPRIPLTLSLSPSDGARVISSYAQNDVIKT